MKKQIKKMSRREYATPRLVVLGAVHQLTRGQYGQKKGSQLKWKPSN